MFSYTVVLMSIFINIQARDKLTIDFVKSYIDNEHKPTDLNYNYLGWDKSDVIKMAKEVSHSSIKSISTQNDKKTFSGSNTLFLVDLEFTDADVFINATNYLRLPYRWLILGKDENTIQFLWDLPILLDSDFVLALRNGNVFTMTELYKPSPQGPTYSTPRGFYNGTLVDTRARRELFRRRWDIMGHPLTKSITIQDTNASQYHIVKEDRLFLDDDSVPKVGWILSKLAFEMLNGTPSYIFSHRYGYKNKNGSWPGESMIRDVFSGRAELGSNCIVSMNRLEVVTFIDCLVQFKLRFVFRQPPLSHVANIYALPFSKGVWIAVVVSIVVSILAVFIASKWEATFGVDASKLDGKMSDAVFLTMSALSQQGSSMEPRGFSGRTMFWVIFALMMSVYTAYSANIVVLLQAPSTAIRNLEQLAYSKMTLAAQEVDFNHFVLKEGKDPIRKTISKRIHGGGKDNFYSLDECVERMRQGLFAFHSLMDAVYRRVEAKFIDAEKCDLMEIDFVKSFDPFVPANKESPYLELLKVSFKIIQEVGFKKALDHRYCIPKPKCSDNVAAFNSIGIQNVRSVLFLIVFGVLASILILVLEIIYHTYQQNSKRHSRQRTDQSGEDNVMKF